MKIRFTQTVRNISYSFSANLISMLLSVLLVAIVPKALGVEQYAYWQLYVFYTSYVGFFHFGWCDGIYLRYGGMEYSELDKALLHSQYWLLTALEVAVAVAVGCVALFAVRDADKTFVLAGTAACCVLVLPRTMLQFLLQGSGRIKEYARNITTEKVIYAFLVIMLVLAGVRQYKWLLLADIAAKIWAACGLAWICRDIVTGKGISPHENIRQAWANIIVGVKLLFANLAGQLLIGIVRFSIERVWDVSTFGKVSFSMTVSNLMMLFISAVGISIFPVIKRMAPENQAENYGKLRDVLSVIVLGLFILYYPGRLILSAWLPQYAESLRYMALLFPVCLFEGTMSMLVNPYMKALRMEKQMLLVNGISVAVSAILTAICVYRLRSLTLGVLSILSAVAFRCVLSEALLSARLRLNLCRQILSELFQTALFVVSGWLIGGWAGVAVYAAGYVGYIFLKRKTLFGFIRE